MDFLSPKQAAIIVFFLLILMFVIISRPDTEENPPEEPEKDKPTKSVCIEGVKYWNFTNWKGTYAVPAFKAQTNPELILCEPEKVSRFGDEF